MQFWPPDDEHMCSKHVEAWNKTYCETKILCIKLDNYWDKYTEMQGQQNVKICYSIVVYRRYFAKKKLSHSAMKNIWKVCAHISASEVTEGWKHPIRKRSR